MKLPLINRWYQMLQLFMIRQRLSLEELKKETNTSSQTVKNSIELLNEQLEGVAEIIQESHFYTLEIIDYDMFDSILTGSLKEQSDFNSPSKRMAYIIQKLLDTSAFVLIDDLSQELEVSRGTVNNDLKNLKNIIVDYDISLNGTPNRGLKLVGEELDFRLLCLNYSFDYFYHESLTENVLTQIKQLSKRWKLDKKNQIFWEKVIILTLTRIKKGYSIAQPISDYLNTLEKNKDVEELVSQLELDYFLSLGQYDVEFLLFPVTISYLGENPAQFDQLREIFDSMMKEIHETVIVELDEEQIFKEVRQHLYFLINRLIFRVKPTDLFQEEIKFNYPFAYQLSTISIHVLETILKRTAVQSEISYLAIYFELVLRNSPKSEQKKIAIVCMTGRGTAALIRRQIGSILGSEVKIYQFLKADYEKIDLNQFFAVFTTVPLNNTNTDTPVIQITNLFNDDWLRSEWNRINQERLNKFDFVYFYFKKFTKNVGYKGGLDELFDYLLETKQIDTGFPSRVLAREENNTTVFSNGIAFPHAMLPGTDHIVFALGVFEDRVETDGGPVELVFLVGIPEIVNEKNENELLQLYDMIFTLAAEDIHRKEILALHDVKELKGFLRGKGILQ